ncbi:unnamed protein product [Adineta steineri]|uniref:Uncharacterized protein n=1 Tax=Adineta steineri TaxID=433720 RepID=A0A819H1E0_9BILA|nr:unnamed protein product [Adineta steineri]CAF0968428.1 unnamed protein product [Adineta steineri]CAF3893050.1 unnamed protein product [Adineta steineri]CAF4172452.1 unnamed protein product [Adineta steineri]
MLQKYNEHSIECKTDFTLNAPQILILANSYSNKIILIDLAKLQMNTDSSDNRNFSSIKQHRITFDNFSANYSSWVTSINCPLNSQNDSSGFNNYAFIDQIFNENLVL